MYNRVYNFSYKNNVICPLHWGFRKLYSTFRSTFSLTKDFIKNLDKRHIGCGIFVDLQNAFVTVEHDTLFCKA